MKAALGPYFYDCSAGTLTKIIKSEGANQTVANMGKKRAIVYSEPPEHSTLKGSVIKELTGSSCICARGLYSTTTETHLQGTHILLANKIPSVDNVDEALAKRLLIVEF